MTRFVVSLSVALALAAAGLSAQQPTTRIKTKKARASVSAPATTAAADSMRNLIGKMGIDGSPSTLVSCVGGKHYVAHPLGFSVSGTRIRVDVLGSDELDPVAALTVLQMGGNHPDGNARASYVYDDDSGGNLDPRIEFRMEYDGNVVLNIGSFDGDFGCYWVKVTVTVP
jgi:hypothetical protein